MPKASSLATYNESYYYERYFAKLAACLFMPHISVVLTCLGELSEAERASDNDSKEWQSEKQKWLLFHLDGERM